VLFIPLVGAVLSAPLTVAAQTGATETPAAELQRVPGWVFTPALSVGGTWDDNVLVVHREDTKPGDFGSPIGPGLRLDYTGRLTRFSSAYEGSFVLYRELSDLNSSHQTLRASFEHRPTKRLLLFGHEDFTRAPTTDAVELAGIPFYRVGTRSNSVAGGFEAALAEQTSLRAAYTLQSVDFDFDELLGLQLRGGHAHQLEIVLSRSISSRLSIGGDYSLQSAFVAGIPDLPQFPDDRFSIHSAGVTATYQLGPTVTVTGGAGFARLMASLTQEARTGPTFRAGIAHRARRAVVSGGYQRSFVPSFGFGGTFQNEEWNANALIPFARNRAYVNGAVSWLINDTLDAALPTLRSLHLTSTIGYRATRWLRIEGFYTRSTQNTHPVGGTLSRNQVGFQIVTAKPFYLR
jgi:hypothetical protein